MVSAQEDAVYSLKHPSESAAESTTSDPYLLGKNLDELV